MTRHQPGVWEGCTTYLYVIPPEGFLLFTEGYLLLVDRSLFLLSRPKYQRSFDTIFSQLLLTLQSGYEKKNPPTRRSSFESNQDPAELAFGNRTKHSFKNNDLCIPPLSITCNLVTRTPEPRIITILKSSRADNIFAPNCVRGTDGILILPCLYRQVNCSSNCLTYYFYWFSGENQTLQQTLSYLRETIHVIKPRIGV